MVTRIKFGREICIQVKIDKVETKFGVRQILTITCAKEFFIFEL